MHSKESTQIPNITTFEFLQKLSLSLRLQVLEGKQLYVEMIGNLCPVIKAGEKLSLTFKPFVENRFQFTVRIKDTHQELFGRLAFVFEPRDIRGDKPAAPVCNLNIVLPSAVHRLRSKESTDDSARMLNRISGEIASKFYLGRFFIYKFSQG